MKNESPSLSVIVVVHEKYLKYLNAALDALKRQTLHNFETIIVGNGCQLEIEAIETAEVPLSEACNIGISQARGEYIVRLDADDWLDETILERELEYIRKTGADAVWCDYVTAHKITGNDDYTVYDLNILENDDLEHACGVMFKRSVWDALDGYDESLRYQESYDFWQRFKRAGFRAERMKLPLYIYRRGHESMSTNSERLEVRRMLENKYG